MERVSRSSYRAGQDHWSPGGGSGRQDNCTPTEKNTGFNGQSAYLTLGGRGLRITASTVTPKECVTSATKISSLTQRTSRES